MTDEKFLVLTNNPLLYQEAVRIPFPVLFYQEKLERLAERAVKLRKQGYCFCADPLGGYYFRYNPYHTLFLERQKKEQKKEKDDCLNDTVLWEALTNSIMGWEQMEKQEKEEKMLEDYQALDQSIAQSTIRVLLGGKESCRSRKSCGRIFCQETDGERRLACLMRKLYRFRAAFPWKI